MSGVQSRIGILADSKSGKSVKLMELVEHAIQHRVRFVVGDHMSQWSRSYWPREYVRIERTQNLEKLCRMACELAPAVVVFDEVDLVVNSRRPIDEKSAIYEVQHMGRQPRPPGADDVLWPHVAPVGLWWCARRPGNVRPDVKDTLDRIYVGRMHSRLSRKWIADLLDNDALVESLKDFKVGEFVFKDLQ